MNQEQDTQNTGSKRHVNRKYKDSLFRMIFNEKKDLLDLYNAVNNTSYDLEDDLTMYTLENALYISYKNDVSFLLDEMLNLYEHQSTLNPNMPIRGLLYMGRNYEAYIERNHLDIYSSVLQTLPLPQYLVFYNGEANAPDREVMELKDAFPTIAGKEPCLNCTATLLNINYGHNKEIMEHCQKLKEYAQFIHCIRMNLKNHMPFDDAVHLAVDDCIARHILEDFLTKNRAEVESMVLSSFDQENHDRILKEAYLEQGIEKGKSSLLENQIQKKLARGRSVPEIAQDLEQDEETIKDIIKKIKQKDSMAHTL